MCVMGCFYRPKWAESPLPEAIRGKNGMVLLPATAVMCRKNCTEFGCDQRREVGFNEDFGLFEVPCTSFVAVQALGVLTWFPDRIELLAP